MGNNNTKPSIVCVIAALCTVLAFFELALFRQPFYGTVTERQAADGCVSSLHLFLHKEDKPRVFRYTRRFRPFYRVEIEANGYLYTCRCDAKTGAILEYDVSRPD